MKSLHCGIGGMETHQKACINHFMQSTNITLYIVTQEIDGIELYRTNHREIRKIGCYQNAIEGLTTYIENNNNNIFFSNDFWTLETLSYIRLRYDKGLFMIRSGGNDIEKMPWGQNSKSYEYRRQCCINALNSLDVIVVNSRFSKDRFLYHGISEDKLEIIRGGVNQELCNRLLHNKSRLQFQLRNQWGISQPYIFTFACRFVPFKGIELALRGISSSSYRNQCHILFAGEGELEKEINYLSRELGLNATFLGCLSNEEVLCTIAGSHLFFNTSVEYVKTFKGKSYVHTETMGRSMMEAISVHTPIICTRVGGTIELFLENDDIGIITESNEVSICKAIEQAMSKEYTFRIRSDYSWNHIFRKYEIIFYNNINT